MANLAAVAKVLAALVTDEKARKRLGWALVAILAPVIVTAALICSLAVGAAEHNASAVRLCFDGGALPAGLPLEYRTCIEEMRDSFALLDSAVGEVNGQMEDGKSLGATRVKAVFYALFFGAEVRADARSFTDCFVTYEERTRTVTEVDEEGNEIEVEESYTVAVPVGNLAEVYLRISELLGVDVSNQQQANAESVYQVAKYGYVSGGAAGAGSYG